MAWTPFGKSNTSTVNIDTEDQNQQVAPPHLPIQDQAAPGQDEGNWFSNFEGQLAVDVYQTNTDIVIKAPIAGVDPDEIEIAITDDVVTIKGERRHDDDITHEDYYCQECYYGVFSRSIILPVAVSTDEADAAFSNGVLTITIPKADKAKTKKLTVKTV